MKSPFKFLDSYAKEDREIYFGREREIDELYHRMFESRILLVYGESGTGKSSLVNCGLINKLHNTDNLPIWVRRYDNILESLSDSIQGLLKEPLSYQLLTTLLFKKALRSLSLESSKQVFFIFDQFEELFIFGSKEEKLSLIQVVKALVESDLDCRFIFIIREEYFSNVAEFKKHIPNFLSNRMRIEKMDRTNAISAITGPCNVHNIQVEEGFAESLLKKLNPESPGVELTYLQIFLDKIFNLAIYEEKTDKNGKKPLSFTIGLVEKAGDVSDLLGSFLNEQISLLGKPEMALAILKSFVSYKGTKRQLNLAEVKDYANTLGEHVKEKYVLEIIGTLVHLRILCEKNENGFYELRHDALAAKIFEKISGAEIEILEVRQFIESAHYFWKKHGVLLSDDDLNYIGPFEKRLALSEELTSFIEMSRMKLNKSRTRKRNIIVTGGIIIILLLSVFSIWALKERNRAEGLNIRVLAEKYNLLATNIAIHDPTKGLRLAEYAYSLDSANQSIQSNIKRIYSDNIFYTLIAKQEDAITSVTFSPDNKYILTGSGDATARIWDLNGNMIKIFIGHSGHVNSVAFSPDGQKVLTGSDDGTAKLWDMQGNVITVFSGHKSGVTSVAFSPDGLKVLTGSKDATARLWDINGTSIIIFKGHNSTVKSVAFSSDGKTILTGSDDYSARLWDLNGNILATLKGQSSAINSVAFSPDGKSILIGMDNGSIRRYPIKMPYYNFNKINKYEKLSSFDKLLYNITDINSVSSSKDEKTLLQASDYNINEAIQSGMSEKSKYLNNAIGLYNKLLKEHPEKKEYLFYLLRASVYDYEANPTDQKMMKIEKINNKILSFQSIDDLTLAGYTYCLLCIKYDSTVIRLKFPDSFLRICSKLMTYPDLQEAERKDISRWCSFVSAEFIKKKEFTQALQALQIAQLSDSTNIELPLILPLAYIFNNQYDKAEILIKEFKDKSLTGFNDFKTYREVYKYSIDLLEDRAITHPDFAKAKVLLKD
jgi:WD40 repeat protein/energy-coupling factor transporter ATP-binding protein EcfA2